jgi:hypothetical protein
VEVEVLEAALQGATEQTTVVVQVEQLEEMELEAEREEVVPLVQEVVVEHKRQEELAQEVEMAQLSPEVMESR